jgi:MFS superfamily sulfate permease-like transporter
MIAALFGSSRQLATGPVAVVSLMTAASLSPLATTGSDGFIAYAILLALIVGAFQFLLGILRLGLVVNFLSHPVVNGFTNGAAIIIATSQLSKMFGVYVDEAGHHYETIIRVVQAAIHYTHWPTLIMGIGAFAIMFVLKKINPRIPNVLVAVTITTVISWAIGFEKDVKIDISKIDSLKTTGLIASFNKTLEKFDTAKNEQTIPLMEEAKKNQIELLNINV